MTLSTALIAAAIGLGAGAAIGTANLSPCTVRQALGAVTRAQSTGCVASDPEVRP